MDDEQIKSMGCLKHHRVSKSLFLRALLSLGYLALKDDKKETHSMGLRC